MNIRFLEELKHKVSEKLNTMDRKPAKINIGYVVSSADGIIVVSGLPNAAMNECLEFEDGRKALVWKIISHNELIATFLGPADGVKAGETVKQTHSGLEVPVGKGLLGRVVDALGNPIDGKGSLSDIQYVPCKSEAPPIRDRAKVCEPYHTGNKGIDMLIPIGRGQRELIIGDRNTGKTTIAIDSIIHQSRIQSGVVGIYVAIGQRMSVIARLVATLTEAGAMANSIVVVASASDAAIMQVLAPLTGCAIGEYFMNNGGHAVIVYDDLWKHAIAYRQISLLLRRSPGREAFPGDTFFQHASLLERCANLVTGGSLTGLPIVETQAGDITAYIPTNVISITDGQIFLDSSDFKAGRKPAINFGLSVSRVGSAAQWKATSKAAGKIKMELAQFRELQEFTKGSEVSEVNARILEYGYILSSLFFQSAHETITAEAQCALFEAAKLGIFKDEKNIRKAAKDFIEIAKVHGLEMLHLIKTEKIISEYSMSLLLELIKLYQSKKEQEQL